MENKKKQNEGEKEFRGPFHSGIIIDAPIDQLFFKKEKNLSEMKQCLSLNGEEKCGLHFTTCRGSMNHSDMGGKIYTHTKFECSICESNKCDFTSKQWESGGWY